MIKILIILILLIFIFFYNKKIEKLELSDTMYTYPREGQLLRNNKQLGPRVYRITNTILTTATSVIRDDMDKLVLPEKVKDNFDEWIIKGFISPVKDQMLCGGCWAFATCSSLADRISIATNGKWYSPYGLSEQYLISCGGDNGMEFYAGCEGGIPQFAIEVLNKEGVPMDEKCENCIQNIPDRDNNDSSNRRNGVVNPNNTNTCLTGGNVYATTDYTWWQTGCDSNTSCSLVSQSTCPCNEIQNNFNKLNLIKYKTIGEAHTYTFHGDGDELKTVDLWPDIPDNIIKANVERMKKAIYYEGPITVGIRITQDFYEYWNKVSVDNYYKYDGISQMAGGHAVVIVGWNKLKDGTPVWIVKNSWGENGGYGFPNGPKWINPRTGIEEIKYKGGFWNHIMGINDSFIESNSVGAHPDLDNSEIKKYLPDNGNNINKEWFKTMTLRDIYENSKNNGQQPIPQPIPPKPIPQPIPPKPDIVIQSDKFNINILHTYNIKIETITNFFQDKNNYYLIGSITQSTIEKILNILPNKNNINEEELNQIIILLSKNIKEYIIIGMRGEMNNYYYIEGNPLDWMRIINTKIIRRAATIKKFAIELYIKLQKFNYILPIIEVSKKEKFIL
jgi:hypothetical protein